MQKCCEFCGKNVEDFKRNTRKYCSDNCKQLAYYARQGMQWGKTELSGSGDISVNVKHDFTLNNKQNVDPEKEASVEGTTPKRFPDKQDDIVKPATESQQNSFAPEPYRKVESSLLNNIEQHCERIEKYFHYPEHYWTPDAISKVKWVTVRVRCLLDNILRLSNGGCIDRLPMHQLAGALDDLAASVYFRRLPPKYPFTELVQELKAKFQRIIQHSSPRGISFRISPTRKAQFMAYRFVISGFVPKCKFSELNFSDRVEEKMKANF